jgi:hypothetical protein
MENELFGEKPRNLEYNLILKKNIWVKIGFSRKKVMNDQT